MGKKINLSVIILRGGSYDAHLYETCIKSASFADEIVNVDTNDIKGNFADWRNEGLKKAGGEWVLYIDTDEEISVGLKNEIEEVVNSSSHFAYAIPRKNFIFGKEFKHGGQWPDYQKRLFLKNGFKGWIGSLHEEPVYDGTLGHLKNPILHRKNINISQMVDKTNIWSETEAKLMFDSHHPPMNFFRFVSAGLREFWLRMIIQSSFMDGTEGTIYGLYQVYSRLISYSKLWEMQTKNESSNS